MKQTLLIALLESLIENIKTSQCNLNDSTMDKIINVLTEANDNVYNITKKEACRILNCSYETFNNLLNKKVIPLGHYDNKHKVYKWSKNEINVIKNHIREPKDEPMLMQ